jgi:acetate kinase
VTTTSVLVLNAGSSSLKYQVVDPATGVARAQGHFDRMELPDFPRAFADMTLQLEEQGVEPGSLMAVGHRVVHGGPRFQAPTLIDDQVLTDIDDLARLAPLHNPPAAAGIRHVRATYPDLPQVAVFDTAWFAELPEAAATYALDVTLLEREGVRRYGMHGISHRYVAHAAARHLGRDVGTIDQIVLHLGNGASAAAVRRGRPLDTSMGFTPPEGLVMGTRAGDVDPGVLLHLLRHAGLDVDALEDLLHHRSGLQGMAGIHDVRALLAAVDAGNEGARMAYDVYCYRVRKYVGAYLAVLGGADAIVFTAGVGEHSPRVRADALRGLDRLGIELDDRRNGAADAGAQRVSTAASRTAVLVVPTNEELAVARDVVDLLG